MDLEKILTMNPLLPDEAKQMLQIQGRVSLIDTFTDKDFTKTICEEAAKQLRSD
jgi:hypothetical protein